MILHFSIINVPLSLWPTSEETKSAGSLFASLVVLMDVKPKGLSLTGPLQCWDISAAIRKEAGQPPKKKDRKRPGTYLLMKEKYSQNAMNFQQDNF